MNKRETLIKNLQNQVQIVGVSKNRSLEEITALYHDGITIFGENRVQELSSKYNPGQPWQWHFIGHLQKNKVKHVVGMVTMIHSVDSIALIELIEKHAKRLNKEIDILIQVNLSEETSKFGCHPDEVTSLVESASQCEFVKFRGFMTMGPTSQNIDETNHVFEKAYQLFETYEKTHPQVDTLSMGMSSDYQLALAHHTTMIRLGTILFSYSKNAQPQ